MSVRSVLRGPKVGLAIGAGFAALACIAAAAVITQDAARPPEFAPAQASPGPGSEPTLAPDPPSSPSTTTGLDPERLEETLRRAERLPRLRSLIIARNGVPLVERVFRGPSLDRPVNIKSVSKTVLSALAGIAIDRGVLQGVAQRIAPVLGESVPEGVDPRVEEITVDHLLSLRTGLERTSGRNYGRWVRSRNWVRFALSRPFVDEPGGRMLYSTGSTHLLSAVLTRASGRSTLDLAREWLGEPLGIKIPAWQRDPQGVYFGGNNMTLSPRALLRFGETYRQGGMFDGKRIVSESWVRASWTPVTMSPFTGDSYGYGWFITEAHRHLIYYAWGYGGQMLYVTPSLGLTIVMTSNPHTPSGHDGYIDDLHALVTDGVIPAAERGNPAEGAAPRRDLTHDASQKN